MIPKNPGTIQTYTQESRNHTNIYPRIQKPYKSVPKNPGAPPKSTQNNGTSPYHDICEIPPRNVVDAQS